MPNTSPPIRVRDEVAEALASGRPVVALESTLIAHGLPRPDNLTLAHELESIVRDGGGVPATIGVIQGEPIVGLNTSERERGPALALGWDGATTVASTALLASRVGIRVFATGGLGGVHRGAQESFD